MNIRYTAHLSVGPRGGIGRRAWFRSMCRKVWGFESLRGHQVIKTPLIRQRGFSFPGRIYFLAHSSSLQTHAANFRFAKLFAKTCFKFLRFFFVAYYCNVLILPAENDTSVTTCPILLHLCATMLPIDAGASHRTPQTADVSTDCAANSRDRNRALQMSKLRTR